MAVADFIEPAIKDYATQAKATYSAPINTDLFTGRQFVAGQDPMQTQAAALATQGVGSYSPYLQAAQTAQQQGAGALGQSATAVGGLGAFQTAGGQAATSAGNIAQGAAGMTGAQAYQPFMSPYQSQVINATLSEFDKQRVAGQQKIKDQAAMSGNFGGGREGAQLGQYQADSLADRSALQASMLQQGFGQAQNAAQQNFANQGNLFQMQQGLGNMQSNLFNQQNQIANAQQGLAGAYGNQMNQQFGLSDFNRTGMGQDINALGSLGSVNQAQNQALLNADRQQAQTGAYEPYGRLSQYGNALTGLAGGVAGSQYQDQQQTDPYASALAGATGVAGLFGQIYGGRNR
jgi:hypothetical protein